jgi:hypothetical protein
MQMYGALEKLRGADRGGSTRLALQRRELV